MEQINIMPAAAHDAEETDRSDVIDLRALWLVLRRRVRLILAIMFVFLSATLLFTLQLEREYTGLTRVLIDPRDREIVNVEAVVSDLRPDTTVMDTEVRLLLSRAVTARVVDMLHLVEDPEFNPVLREPTHMDRLMAHVRQAVGASVDVTPPEERIQRQITIDVLTGSIGAWREGLTFVIGITATSRDPQKAADIANAVAQAYIEEQVRSKAAETRRAGEWLAERLSVLRDEVRNAESAVEQFRIDNNLVDTGGVSVTEAQIAELNAQLVILQAEVAEKEARLGEVRRQLSAGGRGEDMLEVINSPLIMSLRTQRTDVLRTLADISTRYGERHPERLRTEQELADVEASIDVEVDRVVSSLETEAVVARDRVAAIDRNLQQLRTQLNRNNVSLIRLRELEREAGATRAIYESLLARAEEVTEQESLTQPDARVVALAEAPFVPSSPNHKLNLGLGLVAGLAMAGVVVVLLELTETGYTNAAAAERSLGVPVLATVTEAHGAARLKAPNVADVASYMVAKPNSAYAESIRALYTGLAGVAQSGSSAVIAVSSALPGEGKTTLTLSLARMAAALGAKVMVVDADTRRRQLTQALNRPINTGFLEVLTGEASLHETIVHDEQSGLAVLPAAPMKDKALTLVGAEQARAMFAELKREYDLVLLDCPPVLPVVEARVVSAAADGVVYAVRWRKTDRKAVQLGLKTLLREGATLHGAVLTRAKARAHALYAGFGGSSYSTYAAYYQD